MEILKIMYKLTFHNLVSVEENHIIDAYWWNESLESPTLVDGGGRTLWLLTVVPDPGKRSRLELVASFLTL